MTNDEATLAHALSKLSAITQLCQASEKTLRGAEGEEDPLEQQKLYEQWLRREQWLLRREAIPLALAVNPKEWESLTRRDDLRQAERLVWTAVKKCIADQGLPRVIKAHETEDGWSVSPADFYLWAKAEGIAIPEPFEALIQFILRVVKRPEQSQALPCVNDRPAVIPQSRSSERETVLGAALNILTKCPEKCYDEHGFVSGAAIADIIESQSTLWFDSPDSPWPSSDMAALIDKWLE